MRAIDLFSGAGGMSLGATLAGIEVVGAVESDMYAAQTFQHNFPSATIATCDIREFKSDTFKNIDMVFGGPPCQGFSTSNQRNRGIKNSKNWLFEEFFRVVSELSPEWVVLENVKGILDTEQAFFFNTICDKFKQLGYNIKYNILNALHYGIPQNRNRIFIVGSKSEYDFDFSTRDIEITVSVRDAIQDLPILANGANECTLPYSSRPDSRYAELLRRKDGLCSNNLVTRNSNLVIERYGHVPPGGNWEAIPDSLMQNYKNKNRCHTGIYRRLEWEKPSCVIGNYRKNMLIHPAANRGLSVREAARLQSFPDNFLFLGSIGFQQQQVGNAVPPLLSKAVFSDILRAQ